MSRPSPNFGTGLIDLFLAPASLFDALRGRRWWGLAAFALILVAHVVSTFMFIGPMSDEWIVEQQIQQMPQFSEQEIEAVRPQLLAMAPHAALFGVISSIFMLGLVIGLFGSLYLLLTRIAGGERHGWVAWLRLTTWTQLPLLLFAIGLIVLTLIASTPDQPMGLAGYSSLNNLVLNLPPGHPWYTWALSLNLFYLWSILLAAIGIRRWTGTGWLRAGLIAAAPYVLVFGLWAAFVR